MTTITEKEVSQLRNQAKIGIKISKKVKEQKEQIEQLKQDNKKLIDNGGYVSEGCANHMFSKLKDDLLIQLREENKKLKEKYETFRVRNCDRMEELVKALSPWKKNNQDHKSILEAIVELKQENEELEEELEIARKIIDSKETSWKTNKRLLQENEKLKEENKKLQEHLDKAREVSNKLIGENNTTMPSQSCLYRENKKLIEEIKELNKKKSIKWSREYAMPLITKLKEELKLKDEIIKLQETS